MANSGFIRFYHGSSNLGPHMVLTSKKNCFDYLDEAVTTKESTHARVPRNGLFTLKDFSNSWEQITPSALTAGLL